MEAETTRNDLLQIWNHLLKPHRAGRPDGGRSAHEDVIADGWGSETDVQDMVWERDDRADALLRHTDAFEFLLPYAGLIFVTRYRGPFGGNRDLIGHNSMRAADVAAYIMEIERLGFSVDAEPLVEALRPSLIRQRYLTNSEVSVVRYRRERHRSDPLIAKAKDARPDTIRSIKTHTGYQATGLFEGEAIVTLRVDAFLAKTGWTAEAWAKGEIRRSNSVHA